MAKKGTYAERAANPSRRWPKILIITLISGYFSLGGVSIPFFFLFPAYFVYGKECFILAVILFLLCFFRHYPYGKNFPAGAGKKTYLLKIIAQKLKK